MSSAQMMRLDDRSHGYKSLTATVVSLYILLTLSLIQVLGVPYILLSGVSDPLLLAGEILIIAGVSIPKQLSLVPLQLAKGIKRQVSIFSSAGDLPSDPAPTIQQI